MSPLIEFIKGISMFNEVFFTHDEKNKVYIFRGLYGSDFKRIVERKILSPRKTKLLFIRINWQEVRIHEFFALELLEVLKYILSMNSRYGINVVSITKLITILEERTWLAKQPKNSYSDLLDYDVIKEKMRFKILDHQHKAFDFYNDMKNELNYRGGLLDADPGTGKTFMALALSEALHSDRVVIIAPLPSIDTVWMSSLTDTVYKHSQSVYKPSEKDTRYNGEKFILTHYEALGKLEDMLKEIKSGNTTVIIDESHNFNEMSSKRTKLLLKIIDQLNSNNNILLSGTPIKAKVAELVPMLHILDPRYTSNIDRRFVKLYNSPPTVLKDTLPKRYGVYTVKITKDDIGLPKIYHENINVILKNARKYTLEAIRVDMLKYIRDRAEVIFNNMEKYEVTYNRLYKKAKELQLDRRVAQREFDSYEKSFKLIIKSYQSNQLRNILATIKEVNAFERDTIMVMLSPTEKKEFSEAKTILKYLALKLQGEVLANVVGRARINCHVDMANEIKYSPVLNATVKKSVIFTNYIDVATKVTEMVKAEGYKPLAVYGPATKQLTSTVNKFMTEPEWNPMVATYKSLSTAVPLIAANVMLLIDLPFRQYIMEQAIARIHRLGQDKSVYVYQLRLDTGGVENINSRNVDIIKWSTEAVAEITGVEIGTIIATTETTEKGRVSVEEYIDRVSLDENESFVSGW